MEELSSRRTQKKENVEVNPHKNRVDVGKLRAGPISGGKERESSKLIPAFVFTIARAVGNRGTRRG